MSSLIPPLGLDAPDSQPPSQEICRYGAGKLAEKAISHTHPGPTHYHPDTAPGFTASDFFSCIGSYPERERRTFFILMTKELFGIRDIIKYGLIFLGYPVSSSLYDNAMLLPMSQWLEDIQQSLGDIDFKAVVKSGISVLGKLNVPSGHNVSIHDLLASSPCRSHVDAGPSSDCIILSRVSFVSAVFTNALHLGIPWHDLISFESESPFSRLGRRLVPRGGSHEETEDGDRVICTRRAYSDYFKDIRPDLMPTDVQLAVRHHPTLDTIPWPSFRSKVIAGISSSPPSIDREDFCLDLLNDGLRCWGLSVRDSWSSASPGDARNWEAAPWFLEKWERLTNGKDGDEWKISSWWWSMQARKCM